MTRLALPAILIVAAALRFWGIGHGLPFTMGRPDEVEAVRATAGFPSGDLNPRWFIYPNLFFWVIWLWNELLLSVERLWHEVPSYVEVIETNTSQLLLGGRLLSALLGVGTVLVVARIGRRLGGRSTELIAATLLATCFLHVRDSHALKADVYLTAMVPVCLWLLARWVETGRRSIALVAGLAIGIATALKYPAVLLLLPAWYASWLRSPVAGWRRLLPHPHMIVLGIVAAVSCLAFSPYLLLDYGRLVHTLSFSLNVVYGVHARVTPPVDSGPLGMAWWYLTTRTFDYHLTDSLRYGAGLIVAVATPIAVGLALCAGRTPMLRLSAFFCLVYYAVISLSQLTQARYMTPLMPLLALLIAQALTDVGQRIPAPRTRTFVLAGIVALLIAQPLMSSISYDRIAARTDTRVQATRWMAAHFPDGAVVAVLGSTYFPIADPELPPQASVAPLELGETTLDRHGVTHVVVHDHPLPFSSPNAGQIRAFAERLTLLAEFTPFAGEPTGGFEELDAHYIPFFDFAGVVRPGPIVRVHRLEPGR